MHKPSVMSGKQTLAPHLSTPSSEIILGRESDTDIPLRIKAPCFQSRHPHSCQQRTIKWCEKGERETSLWGRGQQFRTPKASKFKTKQVESPPLGSSQGTCGQRSHKIIFIINHSVDLRPLCLIEADHLPCAIDRADSVTVFIWRTRVPAWWVQSG